MPLCLGGEVARGLDWNIWLMVLLGTVCWLGLYPFPSQDGVFPSTPVVLKRARGYYTETRK